MKDVVEVSLDGRFANRQLFTDFRIAQTGRNETDNFKLSTSQKFIGRSSPLRGDFGLDHWRYPDQTFRDGTNREHQGFNREALLNDAARPHLQCRDRVFGLFTRGQNQNLGDGRELFYVVDRPTLHLEVETENITRS